MLSGEIVAPTRLLFQYTNALSKSDKLRSFIAPNMKYLITLLDSNRKSAVYTGGDIHGIYRYIEIIGAPTTFTTSGQRSHNFSPSSSIRNDAATLQPIIVVLRTRHQLFVQFFHRIHKYSSVSFGELQ